MKKLKKVFKQLVMFFNYSITIVKLENMELDP